MDKKWCTFKEPLYNGTFDLTGLKSEHAHTYSLPGTGDFTFNMCEGTNPMTCNGTSGTGACLKESATGKEHVLGLKSADAVMKDSTIYFNYEGEQCQGEQKYKLEIIAECDYNNELDPISLIKVGITRFLFKFAHLLKVNKSVVLKSYRIPLSRNPNVSLCCATRQPRRACRRQWAPNRSVSLSWAATGA